MQTAVVSGTVWPQFVMQVLSGGKVGRRVGDGSPELSSPVVIASRLPIVTIDLPPTVFAVLPLVT